AKKSSARLARCLARHSIDHEIAAWPHLDRAELGGRQAGGHPDRLVEIARFDEVEAGPLLLGFGIGSIDHPGPPIAHPHARGAADRLERLGLDELPGAEEAFVELEVARIERVHVRGGHGREPRLVEMDQAKVSHRECVLETAVCEPIPHATGLLSTPSRMARAFFDSPRGGDYPPS